ncbi:MAG: flavodoxin [Muribaculaceae bacterium]|nr:flavodoxin [Muribaculaceae bacterium]
MKRYGIFYGTSTGTTGEVARKIAKALGVADADIHDVATTSPVEMGKYDVLILGSSTWGSGELQDDWYSFVDGAQSLDLSGKTIAIFGVGDETMSDTFCNAVGILYDKLKGTGARFVGEYPATVYHYDHSDATDGATMRGLVLDQVNHADLSDPRINAWADQVRREAEA